MQKLNNIKVITVSAFLVALGVVAGFFKIPVSNILEIRIISIPLAPAGALFGPGIGAIVGMLSDLGGYVLAPTGPYFPGFTLSYGLTGAIFGLILRKGNEPAISVKRVAAAVIVNTLVVNLLLNSLWLNILYPGKGFYAVFTARIIKELIMVPVYIILISALLRPVVKYLKERPESVAPPAGNGIGNEGNDL